MGKVSWQYFEIRDRLYRIVLQFLHSAHLHRKEMYVLLHHVVLALSLALLCSYVGSIGLEKRLILEEIAEYFGKY